MMTTASSNSSGTTSAGMWIWVFVLIVGSIFLSGQLSCATPFAALAALAALEMKRAEGLALVIGTWLANQVVGYLFLGNPHEWSSYGWGAAIGVGAVISYIAAGIAVRHFSSNAIVAAIAALASAFVAFQAVMFTTRFVLPSGDEAFSLPIVAEIALANAVAFVALILVHRLIVMSGVLDVLAKDRITAAS